MGAVVDIDLHLQFGVKPTEHLLRHLYTGNDTLLFNQQFRLAHRILRNAAQRSVVAIANVLGKRQINEPVD